MYFKYTFFFQIRDEISFIRTYSRASGKLKATIQIKRSR